jgi:hypothetical protein
MKLGAWFWVTMSALASLALLLVLFRPALGLLFSVAFEYRTFPGSGESARHLRAGSPVAKEVDALPVRPGSDIRELARLAARVVARRLVYVLSVADGVHQSDPDSVFEHRAVNCLGYSTLYAAVLDRLLHRAGLDGSYGVRTVTGRQAFLGWEFQLAQPFLRVFPSHVYNVISTSSNSRESVAYVVDSNLFDYTGILFVRGRAFRAAK